MVYFVTPTYLKDNTTIGNSVAADDVTPLIKVAADTFVRSYLGTYFYNHLLNAFQAQTLTAAEVTLVQDYIKASVAWRAVTEVVLFNSYQLKNKGVQTQTGDFSSNPADSAINFLYGKYRDKAEFYDNRLADFLRLNRGDYPEFTSTLNKDSTVISACNSSNTSFQAGIMFI